MNARRKDFWDELINILDNEELENLQIKIGIRKAQLLFKPNIKRKAIIRKDYTEE
jgi:hypothetical protein